MPARDKKFEHPVGTPVRFRELRLYRRSIFLRVLFYFLLLYSLIIVLLPFLIADAITDLSRSFIQSMSSSSFGNITIASATYQEDQATSTIVYTSLINSLPTTATITSLSNNEEGERLIVGIYFTPQFNVSTEQYFLYLHKYPEAEVKSMEDAYDILAGGFLTDGYLQAYMVYENSLPDLPKKADADQRGVEEQVNNLYIEEIKSQIGVENSSILNEGDLVGKYEWRHLKVLNRHIRQAQLSGESNSWLQLQNYLDKSYLDPWSFKKIGKYEPDFSLMYLTSAPKYLFLDAKLDKININDPDASSWAIIYDLPQLVCPGLSQALSIKQSSLEMEKLNQVAGSMVLSITSSLTSLLLWLYYLIFVPLYAPGIFANRLEKYSVQELTVTEISRRSLIEQFMIQPIRIWYFGLLPVGALLLIAFPMIWLQFSFLGHQGLGNMFMIHEYDYNSPVYHLFKMFALYPQILFYPLLGFLLMYLGFRMVKNSTGRILIIVLLAVLITFIRALLYYLGTFFFSYFFIFDEISWDLKFAEIISICIFLIIFISASLFALYLRRHFYPMLEKRWLTAG